MYYSFIILKNYLDNEWLCRMILQHVDRMFASLTGFSNQLSEFYGSSTH